MTKLNQIIALSAGKKNRSNEVFTGVYHKLQKHALLSGITRTYEPKNEDGERFPAESKRVQYSVSDAVREAQGALTDLFNIVATLDATNCTAKANVLIDGNILLTDVPVTTLLFLEKQATDMHTFISALPTLDPAYEWAWDNVTASYRSQVQETAKTKKVYKNHIKSPATDKFAAQVEVYSEDEAVGFYKKHDFSGAIPATEKNALLARVRKLQEAVKVAREEANSVAAVDKNIAAPVLNFVFGTAA